MRAKANKLIDLMDQYVATMAIANKDINVIRVNDDQYKELLKIEGTNGIRVEMYYGDYKVEVI